MKALYLSDVQAAKQKANAAQELRWRKQDAKAAAKAAKFIIRTDLHPAIGVLMTSKGVKYYAHVGPDRVYTEGTPEDLQKILGN